MGNGPWNTGHREAVEDMPRKPLSAGESVRRIAIRKAEEKRGEALCWGNWREPAERSVVDCFGGGVRDRFRVAGMGADDVLLPGAVCERCGRPYEWFTVPGWQGPVTVPMCVVCDLGALPLSK